ncbi:MULTISPECIES: glycosyltransferase [unclassified Exiguobacterium]|uniref:CgeB family protein n=1 Tax=unclassified Exiguobacterium TaxID=2644629 RepID=UPI001BE7471F|nr:MULTISPECIES: glycosyltransferase [unclassified Exiguobacterium]
MDWQKKARRAAYLGVQRSKRLGRKVLNKRPNKSHQLREVVPNWYTRSPYVHVEGTDLVFSGDEPVILTFRPNASSDIISVNDLVEAGQKTFTAMMRVKSREGLMPTLTLEVVRKGGRTRYVTVQDGDQVDVTLGMGEQIVRAHLEVNGAGAFSLVELMLGKLSLWTVEGTAANVSLDAFDFRYPLTSASLRSLKPQSEIAHFDGDTLVVRAEGNQYTHYGVDEVALPHVDTARGIDFETGDMDDDLYRFYLKGDRTGTADASLFIATYTVSGQDRLIEVPLGLSGIVRIAPSHRSIRYFIRVNGSGQLENLNIGMIREKSVRREDVLSLKPDMWTIPAPDLIKLKSRDDQLVVQLKGEDDQRRYISYAEMNNSFKLLPTEFPYEVKANSRYRVTLDGVADEGANVVLYIIAYSATERQIMQQVQIGSEKVFYFDRGIRFLRFALRVDGVGEARVDRIRVAEELVSDGTENPTWMDVREARFFAPIPRELHELKVAAIFDEFTMASYKPECQLITFTPDNWKTVLLDEQPDVLVVESAWKGNAGAWEKKIVKYGTNTWEELDALLAWCRYHNIPTVFWNKEDPIHYDRFIETAKRFDYVYTTDMNRVPNYKEDCGHDRVDALPFAAQPKEHNPIRLPGTREPYACFAGSYYANRHESRKADMDRLFAAADKYGLAIYDRNYAINQRGESDQLQFPEQFRHAIRGSLKYNQIAKAYKGYKVMLNVNSVNDSPTMFSRRVFEGLACATPVVSTRSVGVDAMLGDYVFLDDGESDLDETFRRLMTDDSFYEDIAMRGMRHVLTYHTYTQRLAKIVQDVGIPYRVDHEKIAVVAFIKSREEAERVVAQFEAQNYEHKHLMMFLDKFEDHIDVYNTYNTPSISTYMRSYLTHYTSFTEMVESYDWVAHLKSDDYYGPNYLSDYLLAARYAEADVLTKEDYYAYDGKLVKQDHDESYRYVFDATPSRSIVQPSALRFYTVEEALHIFEADESLNELARSGKRIFSVDPYQYVKAGAAMDEADRQEVTL